MKERPILFSAPMVRAILNGTKTQTRRVLKHSTEHRGLYNEAYLERHRGAAGWASICPYGQPGGRLWVRETWAPWSPHADHNDIESIVYKATDCKSPDRWRPSIHMPRWASRITLEVTGVRVERLQDISEADAIAEGVNVHPDHHGKPRTSIYSPVQAYRDLWEKINGPGSWEANPWVWVIEFKRVTLCPPAQLEALCAAANKRSADYIARVAGQQLRRMRESWRRPA